jgi:hypothetical protein
MLDSVALLGRQLDQMLSVVWPAALRGEADAVDRVLRILCLRVKLLALEKPDER